MPFPRPAPGYFPRFNTSGRGTGLILIRERAEHGGRTGEADPTQRPVDAGDATAQRRGTEGLTQRNQAHLFQKPN